MKQRKKEVTVDFLEEIPCHNVKADPIETQMTLSKILDVFDTDSREMLFMYHLEGMTHSEIAEVKGVSRAAVTKRLKKQKIW